MEFLKSFYVRKGPQKKINEFCIVTNILYDQSPVKIFRLEFDVNSTSRRICLGRGQRRYSEVVDESLMFMVEILDGGLLAKLIQTCLKTRKVFVSIDKYTEFILKKIYDQFVVQAFRD